jgi:hypothetical protein
VGLPGKTFQGTILAVTAQNLTFASYNTPVHVRATPGMSILNPRIR